MAQSSSPFRTEDLDTLRSYAAAHGLAATAKTLGVGRTQIASVLAGLHVREGTALVMRLRIEERLCPTPPQAA